jgi:hypothetical protein
LCRKKIVSFVFLFHFFFEISNLMTIVSCLCQNVSVHVADRVSLEQGDTKMAWLISASNMLRVERGMLGVAGIRVKVPSLVEERSISNNWQMWQAFRCLNCTLDVYASPLSPSVKHVLFNGELLDASEAFDEHVNYSPAFKIIVYESAESSSSDLLVAPDVDDEPGMSTFGTLQRCIERYIGEQTELMNERIRAYEEEQTRLLCELQSRAFQDRKILWNKIVAFRRGAGSSGGDDAPQSFIKAQVSSSTSTSTSTPTSSAARPRADQGLASGGSGERQPVFGSARLARAPPKEDAPAPPSSMSTSTSTTQKQQHGQKDDDGLSVPGESFDDGARGSVSPKAPDTPTPAHRMGAAPPPPSPQSKSKGKTKILVNSTATTRRRRRRAVSDAQPFFDFDDDKTPSVGDSEQSAHDSDSADDDDGSDSGASSGDVFDEDDSEASSSFLAAAARRYGAAADASSSQAPIFQACSVPVQIPSRLANWSKPTAAAKAEGAAAAQAALVPASSSTTAARRAQAPPLPLSSSAVAPPDDSASPDAGAAAASEPLGASSSSGETYVKFDVAKHVPSGERVGAASFVTPHQLVLQEESADELSRSFAVPLSLSFRHAAHRRQ